MPYTDPQVISSTGVLTIDRRVTDDEAEQLKRMWQESYGTVDCQVCHAGSVEVTTFGEARPRSLSLCYCPQPSCPCCLKPLDRDGRCTTTFCPIDGHLVPVPSLASRENPRNSWASRVRNDLEYLTRGNPSRSSLA